MSYKRKQEDKRRLKHLLENCSGAYPPPVWYNERKGRLIRIWKSKGKRSQYKWCKKLASKEIRRYLKLHGVYTKKASDLWWNYI